MRQTATEGAIVWARERIGFLVEAQMSVTLVSLGAVLLIFGAFVLLRFSDRPGGTIKFMGGEVSSKGAGLPLIALGVGCIAFGAARFPRQDPEPRPDTIPRSDVARVVQQAQSGDCLGELLSGVPKGRVDTVEVGMQGVEVIGSHESLQLPFAIVLTENGARIGALRMRLYRGNNYGTDLYKIEKAVDANCADVEEISNASRGGNPRELMNWDTMRERLGTSRYEMRIGGEGSINIGFVSRVP